MYARDFFKAAPPGNSTVTTYRQRRESPAHTWWCTTPQAAELDTALAKRRISQPMARRDVSRGVSFTGVSLKPCLSRARRDGTSFDPARLVSACSDLCHSRKRQTYAGT